jgi:hypothetical protein
VERGEGSGGDFAGLFLFSRMSRWREVLMTFNRNGLSSMRGME